MNNVELLKQIYAGADGVVENFAEDFTLISPGNAQTAGTFIGVDEATRHVDDFQRLSDGTYEMENLDTFLANDAFGMVVSRITAKRDGNELDMTGLGLWEFAGGKVKTHWELPADLSEWDKFWA